MVIVKPPTCSSAASPKIPMASIADVPGWLGVGSATSRWEMFEQNVETPVKHKKVLHNIMVMLKHVLQENLEDNKIHGRIF